MPQPKKGPRLGSGPKHQKAMLSNLAVSLFAHERITTTEAKAKMLRPFAERLITKAKDGSVHKRRQVLSVIEDRAVVHKLFDDIGPRFSDRSGGYTRILKLGPRGGDGAPMALVELVEEGVVTRVEEGTGEEDVGGARRRLRRPARRKTTPEDKPVQSRAAQAADDATPGPEGDVAPTEQVVADEEPPAATEGEAPTGGVGEGEIPEDGSDES